MKRIYKVNDLTLCVMATIKTMPFYVWRDITRLSYHSVDLNNDSGGYSMYDFPNETALNKAKDVLNGAMFSEVSVTEWTAIINDS